MGEKVDKITCLSTNLLAAARSIPHFGIPGAGEDVRSTAKRARHPVVIAGLKHNCWPGRLSGPLNSQKKEGTDVWAVSITTVPMADSTTSIGRNCLILDIHKVVEWLAKTIHLVSIGPYSD